MREIPLSADAVLITVAGAAGWAARAAAAAFTARDRARLPAPIVVVGAAMAMGVMLLAAGHGVSRLPGIALGWALLVLTIVDLATLRLPNGVTLPLIAGGLALAAVGWVGPDPHLGFGLFTLLDHGLGAAGGYAALAVLATVYHRTRGRDGLGLGDAKLVAAGGAWLGGLALPATVLIACGLAFAWVGVRWLKRGRDTLQEPLPFGPSLAAAIWFSWLASIWTGYGLAGG
jgi:leader peptidase (prepilin peptidase)/N-methyltransferase